MWVRPSVAWATTSGSIFDPTNRGLVWTTPTNFRFERDGFGGSAPFEVTTPEMTVGLWRHVAFSISRSTAFNVRKLWIDGVSILDTTDDSALSVGGATSIYFGSTWRAARGHYANVMYWDDYVLTDSLVQYLYTTNPYGYYSGGVWTAP